MTTGVFDRTAGEEAPGDFLFTWVPGLWVTTSGKEKLPALVKKFQSARAAKERWECHSYKRIHPGDRAYLLRQGGTIGIFGRGTVLKKLGGKQVLIGFKRSGDDVLRNPLDPDPSQRLLVDENHLRELRMPEWLLRLRRPGVALPAEQARAIDSMISACAPIGRGGATPIGETAQEVARVKSEQLMRPDQRLFSETIRKNYRNKCAVTGCVTPAALEAAHIKTQKDSDDNNPDNGILLRSDIHCLFDRFLITLSEDGTKIETSPELTDPGYAALKTVTVARPVGGPPPSAENIRGHRRLFIERLRRRAGDQGEQTPAVRS